MTGLGFLNPPSAGFSQAFGTNSDGSVVVGMSYYSAFGSPNYAYQAFRSVDGTMSGLGFLSSLTGAESVANAVSGDGSVVVGWSQSSNGAITPGDRYEAFHWTASSMTGLGYLSGITAALRMARTRMAPLSWVTVQEAALLRRSFGLPPQEWSALDFCRVRLITLAVLTQSAPMAPL
jgi:probable HAF family extracellular repeat protein